MVRTCPGPLFVGVRWRRCRRLLTETEGSVVALPISTSVLVFTNVHFYLCLQFEVRSDEVGCTCQDDDVMTVDSVTTTSVCALHPQRHHRDSPESFGDTDSAIVVVPPTSESGSGSPDFSRQPIRSENGFYFATLSVGPSARSPALCKLSVWGGGGGERVLRLTPSFLETVQFRNEPTLLDS